MGGSLGIEASVLSLVVVILIKDVIVPLYRTNGNGKNGNGKDPRICPMQEQIAEMHTASRLHEREFENRLQEFGQAVQLLGKVSGSLNTQTALLERIAKQLEHPVYVVQQPRREHRLDECD